MKIGDKVQINSEFTSKFAGQTFTVENLPKGARGVNYRIKSDVTGKMILAPREALIPASNAATITKIPLGDIFSEGNIVKVARMNETFVITKVNPKRYVVTELGGGKSYSVAASGLTKVELSEILK